MAEEVGLPWYKQLYWKSFLQNVFLFVLVVFLVSPMMTFVVLIGILKWETAKAMIYTIIHFLFAFIVFVVDIMRSVWSQGSKTFNIGMWIESESLFWLEPSEIQRDWQYLQFDQGALPTKLKTKFGGEVDVSKYNPFLVTFKGLTDPRRIIMIPKPHDMKSALIASAHTETFLSRYPIPSNVTYGCFLHLLTFGFEGKPVRIYELVFSPAFANRKYADIIWKNADADEVEIAVLSFDHFQATHYKLENEKNLRYVNQLLKDRKNRENIGLTIADEAIKDYELTQKRSDQTGTVGFLSKYKWMIISVFAVIAIVGVVWWMISSGSMTEVVTEVVTR